MRTQFEATTENAALKRAIVARIQSQGPIAFREFMELALYHPQHGYYCSRREKMGREGDYLTSPEVSPIFGALLARQLREMWLAMGAPRRFDVVEPGAGTGLLCRDIRRWARCAPDFRDALACTIVEISEALRERQRETLADEGDDVRWSTELPEGIEGCLLSNELLDSFPVHRVSVVRGGELMELFVGWDGARFSEELQPPSTPAIEAHFRRLGLRPAEGCRAEVNLAAADWMGRAGRALRAGFVLTLDYGYEAEELYAPWRTDGTLLCFYRHNPSSDPYARLGRQDITSQVDFTTLRRAGEEAGLTTLGLVSQAEFLTNLGIAEALSPPGEGDGLEEYYARRRAVSELLDPAGLGRIRALVQGRGVGRPRLTGLEGALDA